MTNNTEYQMLTAVLVHAAWADGSGWNKVTPQLRELGLRVKSAQIPLSSLSEDVAALRRLLRQVDGPDEMFVVPEARRRGIGRRFFSFIEKRRPFEAVALALEASPRNAGARRLYESLGFRARENTVLTRRLGVL